MVSGADSVEDADVESTQSAITDNPHLILKTGNLIMFLAE